MALKVTLGLIEVKAEYHKVCDLVTCRLAVQRHESAPTPMFDDYSMGQPLPVIIYSDIF